MAEIDLWSDDEASANREASSIIVPETSGKQIIVEIFDNEIHLFTQQDLTIGDFENLLGCRLVEISDTGTKHFKARLSAVNAFVLRYALKGFRTVISADNATVLAREANTITPPHAVLTEDRRHVEVKMPGIKVYREMLNKVNAYPTKSGYRIDLTRVLDLESLTVSSDTKLPQIVFDKEVLQLNREPIFGYDGTVQSLKNIPVDTLNVVSANGQSWKALKTSKKSLKDKMSELGLNSLHDLLFCVPRRYIDKSKPQDLSDLIEGETAVIVGVIDEVLELSAGRGGAVFIVRTNTGSKIRATFFNQRWLISKFKVGAEVLVTGKFSWWNRTPQVSGVSIEHAEEAIVLPIVPVYKQSPSKGITTYLIMSANRELLSRLGNIELPSYMETEGKMSYFDALNALHFPESLEEHYEAIETLAFYELVYMQVIIQEAKLHADNHSGVEIRGGERKLQAKAIKSLPFSLTTSQKRAIVELNSKMSDSRPSSTLLSADVGSGKTVIAQMAALKAVDSGFQSVILSPTEILARQLYNSTKKVVEKLEQYGENVNIVFLSGSMKVKEKKEVLAMIENGEANIIVGTHSTMGLTVKYHNLGFIAIDEQQKFGAEQRTRLLGSREDGLIPDILMQTATPIPRSTAQVFYGDIDIIELKEKPPGRLPIITEWVRENPVDIVEHTANEMWLDVIDEAKKGNQTFIITPLVSESTKIDSASVERTFKSLSQLALAGLNIGYVHGQMKQDVQQQYMEDFRNKKYDVLVASTVVEVGVDIPDATRVIILSAERLGSASLHQIRGRVGRNDKPSKCYLVSLGKTDNSQLRLQSLVDNEDGFEIAKNDLKIRGEGKMFGTEQSGQSEMMFANLAQHSEKINEAKKIALKILESDFKNIALRDSQEMFESNRRMM